MVTKYRLCDEQADIRDEVDFLLRYFKDTDGLD